MQTIAPFHIVQFVLWRLDGLRLGSPVQLGAGLGHRSYSHTQPGVGYESLVVHALCQQVMLA